MDADRLKTFAAPTTLACLESAIQKASHQGVGISLDHVVEALLSTDPVLERLGAEVTEEAKGALAQRLHQRQSQAGRFTFAFDRLFDGAIRLAEDAGNPKVTPVVLLAACLTEGLLTDADSQATIDTLRTRGVTIVRLLRAANTERRDYTYAPLGFGWDLTARYRDDPGPTSPVVGMAAELRQLVARVAGGSESVVLIGEPGVGKSAVIHGLAYHLAVGTRPMVPPVLDDFTIVEISTGSLLADTGGRGDLEKRIDEMLAFFAANRNVVPFFDEIHTLLDTNETATRTIANALKPPMASGSFRCLGATTDQEYARFIAGDRALKSRFTSVLVSEPDFDAAVEILMRSRERLLHDAARAVGLQLSDEALSGAVRLTQRYQRSDRLPRKALRLIGSAIAEKTYALQTGADDDAVLSADDVAGSFSAASGIPLSELDQDSASYAKELSGRLLTHVRGQDPAIEAVTSWLQLQSFGWMDPRRPRGRFLFLGPPGVGKSELANALASEVLHDKASIVVKNMAEYKGEGAKSRFMGADPGYVGFGTTETIYSKVSMRPYSVVVLDEIEKAHSSLADPLLSVLDGAAEDGQGRWVDFSQCIFVMTSNAIQAPADDRLDGETLRGLLREQGGVFTGPFVDRLDRIVLFQPLDRASLKAILDVLITKRRAAATRPLPASLDTPEVRGAILDTAVSQSGAASARGLERALARWLADQAAALLRTS